MRHLLRIADLKADEFKAIVARGIAHGQNRNLTPAILKNKNIVLMFERSSTRTRLSFSVAVMEMGGNAIPIEASTLQIGRGETVEDTTEVFSRYVDAIMIRARSHKSLETMASLNRLSVVNGLTDLHHPCQALADFMTLQQRGLSLDPSLQVSFVGEPNNVFNSLAESCALLGCKISIATPEGYTIDKSIEKFLKEHRVEFKLTHDPKEGVKGADVVYTDVWVSMGQEAEESAKKKQFAPYCVSMDLMKHANTNAMVLHCLPAHRGEEITAEVMDHYADVIFQQAENRLHVQKAILEWIFELL